MSYLAIDYGKKRIGLAIGAVMPRGVGVLDGQLPWDDLFLRIEKICKSEDVETIVIGLPIRSQGEEGTLAGEIRRFGAQLHAATSLPVVFEPEQFTSTEALQQIKEHKKNYDCKGEIDELAAVLLLEQYLAHSQEK
ncbi:MAG: Holliday junction resolvase RuvX [Patescibacteria group bacterium]|jgi:putative Holliday junction resolvase